MWWWLLFSSGFGGWLRWVQGAGNNNKSERGRQGRQKAGEGGERKRLALRAEVEIWCAGLVSGSLLGSSALLRLSAGHVQRKGACCGAWTRASSSTKPWAQPSVAPCHSSLAVEQRPMCPITGPFSAHRHGMGWILLVLTCGVKSLKVSSRVLLRLPGLNAPPPVLKKYFGLISLEIGPPTTRGCEKRGTRQCRRNLEPIYGGRSGEFPA